MYDSIIKKLCEEYVNAVYIDLHDIDSIHYIDVDNVHYNKAFYDILNDRLVDCIYNIENS